MKKNIYINDKLKKFKVFKRTTHEPFKNRAINFHHAILPKQPKALFLRNFLTELQNTSATDIIK